MLINRAAVAAGLYPGWSASGQAQQTLVVKVGYDFDVVGDLRVNPDSPSILEADRYRGEPGASSLLAAADTVPFKDGAEVVISGSAHPPLAGARITEVKAELVRAGRRRWEKTVCVFGPRVWQGSMLGALPGKPSPLEALPLIYEHAFGGYDPRKPGIWDLRNPVGQGFSAGGWRMRGRAMPNVELASALIASPGDRPVPAGYDSLAPFWEPRASQFKEVDPSSLITGESPFGSTAPATLFNAAPLDQRFPEPFGAGDVLHLKGFFADLPITETLSLHLPDVPVEAVITDGVTHRCRPLACDTLLVDCNAMTLCMVCRVALPVAQASEQAFAVLIRPTPTSSRRSSR